VQILSHAKSLLVSYAIKFLITTANHNCCVAAPLPHIKAEPLDDGVKADLHLSSAELAMHRSIIVAATSSGRGADVAVPLVKDLSVSPLVEDRTLPTPDSSYSSIDESIGEMPMDDEQGDEKSDALQFLPNFKVKTEKPVREVASDQQGTTRGFQLSEPQDASCGFQSSQYALAGQCPLVTSLKLLNCVGDSALDETWSGQSSEREPDRRPDWSDAGLLQLSDADLCIFDDVASYLGRDDICSQQQTQQPCGPQDVDLPEYSLPSSFPAPSSTNQSATQMFQSAADTMLYGCGMQLMTYDQNLSNSHNLGSLMPQYFAQLQQMRPINEVYF